jgi:5-methylthioadenosine/S-adenosylhomocysteine deaminase
MRWAGVLGHVAAPNVDAVKPGNVIYSVTIDGAKILGREEIDRLAVGSKADLVLVDASYVAGMRAFVDTDLFSA